MTKPGKIVCIGRNYPAHVREMGNDLPREPVVFFKPVSSLIGPGDTIVLPPESTLVEHEAEIAIVIGKRLRRATREQAEGAIRGFTCANDVTARDLQKKEAQWARAKGWDTFCPVLPGVEHVAHWSIEDPATAAGSPQERHEAFRAARDRLRDRIHIFLLAAGREDLPTPEPATLG